MSEARFFDAYPLAARPGTQPTPGRRPVAFWNLTLQEVALTVAGQRQTLAPGQRLKMLLDEGASWQMEGRAPQTATVPENAAGLTIVIRR